MRVFVFTTREEAQALLSAEDLHRGYPKIEPGIRAGKGRHVESIFTETSSEVVELSDGSYGIIADEISKPDVDKSSVREKTRKLSDARNEK